MALACQETPQLAHIVQLFRGVHPPEDSLCLPGAKHRLLLTGVPGFTRFFGNEAVILYSLWEWVDYPSPPWG